MWTDEQKDAVLKAITVICEITNTQWSAAAIKMAISDLSAYPFDRVKEALQRVRRECKGRLTLAAILDCLDDGYPSAEEAWGLIADGMSSEALTIVIPEIAQLASADARTLWQCGDKYGARQAFVKTYERMKAAKQGASCEWVVEAGTDKEQRDAKIKEAVEQGRIGSQRALAYLPDHKPDTRELLLTGRILSPEQKALGQKNTSAILAMLTNKMAMSDGELA